MIKYVTNRDLGEHVPYGIAAYAGMQRMLISYCTHTVFILLICPISAAQLQYIYCVAAYAGSMLVFMLLI